MEPKIILYLKRIIKTLSISLLWMAINVKLGIMNNYAFFENGPKTKNIIFYIGFLASLIALLYYFFKIWKTDLKFEDDDEF
ncbi:MAG: hypothetical protein ACOVO1_05145 [Chitinophagaceae bacterium]